MIKSHSVLIQSRTTVVGSEGEQTFTYATLKTIYADVQPVTLSPTIVALFGATDLAMNARKMYYNKDSTILPLMRAVVGGKTYEIRAINNWPKHDEAFMVPIQGVGP